MQSGILGEKNFARILDLQNIDGILLKNLFQL